MKIVLLLGVCLTGCGWGYANKIEEEKPVDPTAAPPVAARPAAAARPAPVPARSAPTARRAPTPGRLLPQTPPPDESFRVVEGTNDLFTLGENHRHSMNAQGPVAMGKHAFKIRMIDGLNDATKTIHCSTGKVVHFVQQTPRAALLEVARATGVPLGVWTLTVDTTGSRPDLAQNAWYRHISKFHRLEFIKQHHDEGTVIYRYLGARQARAAR